MFHPSAVAVNTKVCPVTSACGGIREFHGAMKVDGNLSLVALASLEDPETHGAAWLLGCTYKG